MYHTGVFYSSDNIINLSPKFILKASYSTLFISFKRWPDQKINRIHNIRDHFTIDLTVLSSFVCNIIINFQHFSTCIYFLVRNSILKYFLIVYRRYSTCKCLKEQNYLFLIIRLTLITQLRKGREMCRFSFPNPYVLH